MSRTPQYQLLDADLLRRLMQRTGTGQRVTIRELAAHAGCAVGTVGNLLSGKQQCVTSGTAHSVAQAIGVDTLVLFAPTGRATPVSSPAASLTPLREAV
ncbi:XRE family transcriptional regulator [Streptomyces sp. NPDC048644]|uniref:XRE family transcriptional regulator n=1 Tax=Streptomyces sp. NPDC048644 TaxID=3365582 RepID=UPI003714EDF4